MACLDVFYPTSCHKVFVSFCAHPIRQSMCDSPKILDNRGRQLKKFSFKYLNVRDFDPNSWAPPMIFHITSIWSSAAASKLEAVKSSLLNKSFSDLKNTSQICCYSNFKSSSNKFMRNFRFHQLLCNKFDFKASNFKASAKQSWVRYFGLSICYLQTADTNIWKVSCRHSMKILYLLSAGR